MKLNVALSELTKLIRHAGNIKQVEAMATIREELQLSEKLLDNIEAELSHWRMTLENTPYEVTRNFIHGRIDGLNIAKDIIQRYEKL